MTDGTQTPESAIPPQETNQPSTPSVAQEQPQTLIPTHESNEAKETPFNNQLLINFLEKQKYPTAEDQSLTPDQKQRQQEFNKEVDTFIESLTQEIDKPINYETLIKALNFGYQRSLPEQIEKIESLINQMTEELNKLSGQEKENLQQRINSLNQIKQELDSRTEIPEEVRKQIETLFSDLDTDPQLKQQLSASLNNGDFHQIAEIFLNKNLQEKEDDPEETKEAKRRAKNVAETIKKYSLPIGGALSIILLLMIFRASKGESGGNPLG